MKDHKDTASSLRRQAIRLLSDEKLAAIENPEKHLNKVVCITNTLDLLIKVADRERRNRKRRQMSSMSRQHYHNPKKRRKLEQEDKQEDNDVFKEEVDDLFQDLLNSPSDK